MQRRAAAMYVAFFLVIGAAAYGLIATTSAPGVSLDGPTYAAGDSVALADRTYNVSSVSATGSGGGVTVTGELSWTNESAVIRTSIDNGSTVPPTDVVWEGQQARHEATVEAGSEIAFNGSDYRVELNATAGRLTLTNVTNPIDNQTFSVGDTLTYQDHEATVTAVSADAATLVWGDSYLLVVRTANVTDPTEAVLVQQRNVTDLAVRDPALYNGTIVQNGVRKVTFRANDTNVPVVEYFGPVERHTIAEGDTLRYQGNETTVEAVENESVTLAWPGVKTKTIDLAEGENFTAGGQRYFAHFPSNTTVQVLETGEHFEEYHEQNERIEAYHERKLGLWGVAELSAVAAVILLATAFLPVRG